MLMILLGSLVLTATALAESSFSDTEGHRYEYAIDYVQSRGIVNGYDDGTFKPDQLINRAEFTKILVEHLYNEGDFNSFTTENCFSDVPGGEWFTRYVCFAKNKNIINGHPDGNFKPANNINYVEALKIVIEANISAKNLDLGLIELGKYWYSPYIDFVQDNCEATNNVEPGPTQGCLELIGEVAFDENITRAEAAVIIQWIGIMTQ